MLAEHGIDVDFVQDNHSYSREAGTIRGLHFQVGPFAQAKLVRVTRGRILDVAVDIRHGSPSFGRHVASILSADEWNQLFIPAGFAHGFATLVRDTEVQYKVSAPYSALHDKGLLWKDPALGIDWQIEPNAAAVSDKDQSNPRLAELPAFFSLNALQS